MTLKYVSRQVSIGIAVVSALLVGFACAPKRQYFRGPGHDADWPIESPQAEAYGEYLKARVLSNQGDLDEAIEAYQNSIKADPTSAMTYASLAFDLMRKGDFVRAEQMAMKASALAPDLKDAHFLLGKIHAARQAWTEAEADFKRFIELSAEDDKEEGVIALASIYVDSKRAEVAVGLLQDFVTQNPSSIYGYYYLGRVFSELNRPEDALKAYDMALTINPGFTSALKAKGLIYEYQGKKQEAVAAYESILESYPDSVGVRNHLAQIYLEEKDYEKAERELAIVAQDQPENFTARLRLGLLYLQHNKLALAEETLRRLLADAPQKDRIHYYLGVVLEKSGKKEAALKEFAQVEAGTDNYVDARLALAFLHEQGRNLRGAEGVLREGVAKSPGSSALVAALAGVLSKTGRIEEARTLLQGEITRKANDEVLWFALGEIEDRAKNLRGVDEALRKVLEINPDNANALNFLGYTYAEKGIKLDEAEKYIRRALEIRPKDGYITDSLGWVFFKKQQYDEAVKRLEEANRLSPDEPVIMEHLADVLLVTGERARAREIYSKAAEFEQR